MGLIMQQNPTTEETAEESRRQAVANLAGRPLADIADALFAAMGDPSWRIRKEAVELVLAGDVDDHLVSRLVDLLSAGENAGLRNAASEVLERLGGRAVQGLCAALTVMDADVRKFVVDILGAIGSAAAVPFLMPLLRDPEPNVVTAVIETLGKIGDPAVGPDLVALLERDDLCLRFTTLEALSLIKYPVPLPAILPLMGNSVLKKAVYDCFGAVGTMDAVPLLMEGLAEKGRSAREAALVALMQLRNRLSEREVVHLDAQLQHLKGTPLIDTLLTMLETAELPVKRALIRTLGLTGDSRAMIPLLQAANSEEVSRECQLAIRDIGGAGSDAMIAYFPFATETEKQQILQVCVTLGIRTCGAILGEGCRSGEAEVRAKAVAAIGLLSMVDQLDLVAEALDDQEPEVRGAAVEALVQLSAVAADAVRPLAQRLLNSSSPQDRSAAARLLLPVGSGDRLFFLIKDEEAAVRTAAVSALVYDGSAKARHAICLALMDEAPEVRIAAANAIGACREVEGGEPLLLLLADRDLRVQRVALRNLGLLGDIRAVPAITEYLTTATGMLQISAMESLAALSGSTAATIIEVQLKSSDEEVVKAAVTILAAIDPQQLVKHREQLLRHPHWEVRGTMARALCDTLGADAAPLLREQLGLEQDDYVKAQLTILLDRIA